MAKFCPDCNSFLTKITQSKDLLFQCTRCTKTVPSNAEDTLMDAGSNLTSDKKMMYKTLIETSSLLLSRRLVSHVCNKCNFPYSSQFLVGGSSVLTCDNCHIQQ